MLPGCTLNETSNNQTGPERSEHLTRLVVIVVYGLFTHDNHVGLFLVDELEKNPGRRQRLHGLIADDMDRAIRTHSEPGSDLLLAIG